MYLVFFINYLGDIKSYTSEQLCKINEIALKYRPAHTMQMSMCA